MNPALLHNSYSGSYPLTNEIKYSSQDRPYPHTTVVTNEYFDRRDGLASGAINQSMAARASNNGLEYDGNHALNNQSYPPTNSQYLLTPPQSLFDPPVVNNSSTSTFNFSNLPKTTTSNASSLHWNADAPPWQSSFHNMMPDMRQMPAPQMPQLSPPNMNSHFPLSRGPPMDTTYRPSYFGGEPYTSSLMSRNMPAPIPSVYSTATFPPIPPNPSTEMDGPPFDETQMVERLVSVRNMPLKLNVTANVCKGFFTVDEKWTCYRRNYFQVSCAFTFKSPVPENQVFLQRSSNGNHGEPVLQWAVSISAKTSAANNNDSEPRGLVQHTPKRDKATESVPTRHLLTPSPIPALGVSHGISSSFYPTMSHLNSCLPGSLDSYGHQSSSVPPSQYTFERIQFQKATANNGKRRAQQQYFHVVVSLEANVGRHNGPPEWIVVAFRQSAPMVVRGRSPGHYRDNPPNLQTVTDVGDGQVHVDHGGHSGYSLPHIGSNHVANMGWSPAGQRNGHSYGPPFEQRLDTGDYGSVSPNSSPPSLRMSPDKDDCYGMANGSTSRTARPENGFDRILLSPISTRPPNEQLDYARSNKRSYDGDGVTGTRPYHRHSLDQHYQSPSFDFSATATPQGLCASS